MLPVVPPVVNVIRITKQACVKVMRNLGRNIFDNKTKTQENTNNHEHTLHKDNTEQRTDRTQSLNAQR